MKSRKLWRRRRTVSRKTTASPSGAAGTATPACCATSAGTARSTGRTGALARSLSSLSSSLDRCSAGEWAIDACREAKLCVCNVACTAGLCGVCGYLDLFGEHQGGCWLWPGLPAPVGRRGGGGWVLRRAAFCERWFLGDAGGARLHAVPCPSCETVAARDRPALAAPSPVAMVSFGR